MMFSQIFGNYLLNKGYVNAEQLKVAFEFQKGARMRLGVLAINEQFMTLEQVITVHGLQSRQDKRFGEIAIELGFLTEEQLDKLLNSQPKDHLLLAQTLMDHNILDFETITKALKEYKKDHGLNDEEFEAIQNGDISALVQSIFNVKKGVQYNHLKEYISLFSKNIIRFIEDQVSIELRPLPEEYMSEWAAYQKMQGEYEIHTFIATNGKTFCDIASRYAEEEISEPGELAEASVGEFLNLHNGIYIVNLSNEGKKMNMDYQVTYHDVSLSNLKNGYIASFKMPTGDFDVIVVQSEPKITKF